jgi:O-antigen ligase
VKERRAALWTASALAAFLVAPLTAPALLGIGIAAAAAWRWAAGRGVRDRAPSPVVAALALAGIYLAINASWSLSPGFAFRAVTVFLVIVAASHLALEAVPRLGDATLRAAGWGLVTGVALGAAVVCFETFTGQALRLFLIGHFEALRPMPPRHFVEEGGRVTMLMPYLLNRSMGPLVLLTWPAVLAAGRLGQPGRRKTLMLLLLGLSCATIFGSTHETSKLAFLGALTIFGLFHLSATLARRMVVAGWVAANLLVVPAASFVFHAEAYRLSWLPESAKHRIVIWGHTSTQVARAPVLGAGIGSARALNAPRDPTVPRAPGTRFQLSTDLHSHNAYLQAWFETGAVGAGLLLGLGLLILRALAAAPADVQPHLHATFASGALVAASSYSIWAPWFMTSFALAFAGALLAASIPLVRRGP